MAIYVNGDSESAAKGSHGKRRFPWRRRRRLEEALRPVEEAAKAAESAAEKTRDDQKRAVEELKGLASDLQQAVDEQVRKVLAAVQDLKRPYPVDDLHLGRMYREYLSSGHRGDVHRFIDWVSGHPEYKRWVALVIEPIFNAEENRKNGARNGRVKGTSLPDAKKRKYEKLLKACPREEPRSEILFVDIHEAKREADSQEADIQEAKRETDSREEAREADSVS